MHAYMCILFYVKITNKPIYTCMCDAICHVLIITMIGTVEIGAVTNQDFNIKIAHKAYIYGFQPCAV